MESVASWNTIMAPIVAKYTISGRVYAEVIRIQPFRRNIVRGKILFF
jgi:hypothetical protein